MNVLDELSTRAQSGSDAEDIIHLVQANRLDLNAQEVRDLFLRYGTEDLYEKVRRACG